MHWLVPPEQWDPCAWSILDELCPQLSGAFTRVGSALKSHGDTPIQVDRVNVTSGDGGLPADHRLDTFKATIASLPLQWEHPLAAVKVAPNEIVLLGRPLGSGIDLASSDGFLTM
jgi:hypothetical protein